MTANQKIIGERSFPMSIEVVQHPYLADLMAGSATWLPQRLLESTIKIIVVLTSKALESTTVSLDTVEKGCCATIFDCFIIHEDDDLAARRFDIQSRVTIPQAITCLLKDPPLWRKSGSLFACILACWIPKEA